MKSIFCLFERPFKMQKNGIFLLEISFFVFEIMGFFIMQIGSVMTSYCLQLKLNKRYLWKYWSSVLETYWPMKVTNEEVRFKTNMEEITQQIKRRCWKLIGHVLRKSVNENMRIALTWTPEGRRRRDRPKETWRRTVERERGELGFKGWTEAGSCATAREARRERMQGPISLRGKRTWWWCSWNLAP